METFAESKGQKPFDWWKALDTPPEIGSYEHYKLRNLSGRWATCACGNQCDAIPRDDNWAPIDEELFELGFSFGLCIRGAEWDRAKKLLLKIEIRSSEILTGL